MSPNTSLDFLIYSDRYIKISPRGKEVFIRAVIFLAFRREVEVLWLLFISHGGGDQAEDDARASPVNKYCRPFRAPIEFTGFLIRHGNQVTVDLRKTFS